MRRLLCWFGIHGRGNIERVELHDAGHYYHTCTQCHRIVG